ncbi:hypothetical protein O181_001030 [Austropuccinia psidii MF-1]|uniref:OTU domain-containing protein n=1 Tax=Austropuccinia psidii MF-1 TaxID=1389203 RepID=A0A9Q3B9X6_9BASI|nr:hypothetical protein [Austropuccinia psidii MF-1]
MALLTISFLLFFIFQILSKPWFRGQEYSSSLDSIPHKTETKYEEVDVCKASQTSESPCLSSIEQASSVSLSESTSLFSSDTIAHDGKEDFKRQSDFIERDKPSSGLFDPMHFQEGAEQLQRLLMQHKGRLGRTNSFSGEVKNLRNLINNVEEKTSYSNPKLIDLTKADIPVYVQSQMPSIKVQVVEQLPGFLESNNIEGDGNCQFRVISKLLFGSQSYHLETRKEAVRYISAHPKTFAEFIAHEKNEKPDEVVKKYCYRMKIATIPGDDITLLAMTKAYNMNLICVSMSNDDFSLLEFTEASLDKKLPFKAIFHRYGHYELLFKAPPGFKLPHEEITISYNLEKGDVPHGNTKQEDYEILLKAPFIL